jgi:pyrophosphatase PpaX
MHHPTTVLFDLDGTLIDSVDLIVESYQHTFRTHGLPIASREQIVEGIGTPLWTVFGELTEDRAEIERWIVTYREFNLGHHDQRVSAFPGVVEMIATIGRAGRRMGIVTSKNNAGARRGLALIGVAEHFEVVVGSDDVTNPKPHAEPVHRALADLGAEAHEAVFIGDSHHDVASGRAAGVRTVAVSWGPLDAERLHAAGADSVCATPTEVLAALGL